MCTSKRKAESVALCPVWECMVLLVLLDGESRIVGFCTLEISVEGLTVTLYFCRLHDVSQSASPLNAFRCVTFFTRTPSARIVYLSHQACLPSLAYA